MLPVDRKIFFYTYVCSQYYFLIATEDKKNERRLTTYKHLFSKLNSIIYQAMRDLIINFLCTTKLFGFKIFSCTLVTV